MFFERRNIFDLLFLPLGLLAFAALGWWTVYAGPDSADKIAERRSLAVFSALEGPTYNWVNVKVSGQRVVLSGEAPTQELRARAVNRALNASGRGGFLWGGIKHVEDEMDVRPPLDTYRFSAELNAGRITLNGYLPSVDALDRLLEKLSREGFTSNEVQQNVQYAEGLPEGDWIGTAELGLTQLVRLTRASMDLVNKRLVLKGQAPNSAVKTQITQRLLNPPSGYSTDVELTGTAVWSAQIDGDRLVLSGAMPGAVQRTEIVDLASRFFDGEIRNSQLIMPMEQTRWVTGIRAALPGFLQFRSGELAFMGDEIVLKGKASQSVVDYLRQDMARYGSPIDFRLEAEPTLVNIPAFAQLENSDEAGREVCASALGQALSVGRLTFRYGSESLSRDSGRVVDAIEAVLDRCPNEVLSVSAYTHIKKRRTASKRLTEARQRTVSDYFIARGVPLKQIKLTEVKAGETAPDTGLGSVDESQIRLRFEE